MTSLTVGYVRVSTAQQKQEGISVEMQQAKIKQYCALNDLDLIGIYGDPGLSGKSVKARPGIQTVMALVKKKRIQHVVIYKLDRLARNAREALEIADLLDKKGAQLHSITERIDTGSANGRLFYNMLAAMAAWERETAAERTTAALAQKRANGEKTGGHTPYGFRFRVTIRPASGKLLKILEPEPIEQAVIERINDLKTEGMSTRKIAQQLNDDGIKTRKGTCWTQNQVLRVLAA